MNELLLEEDLFLLLQAVGAGDLSLSRVFAESFCHTHRDQIPTDFMEWFLEKTREEPASSEPSDATAEFPDYIPFEVANLVVLEDVASTFNPRRYYVGDREMKLLDEIIALSEAGKLLEKARIPFANTTLLSGPPGVGKTQFGRFLAYRLKLPFVYVDLCRVVGSQMGETGRNLQEIFKFVEATPCLFMLDELDSIGANRGTISTGGSGDEMTRTTIALMQCMDRLPQNVVLIAATNRPDMLDAALRRRFTIKHEFKHFPPDTLVEMVVNYFKDINETGNLSLQWDTADIRSQCGINTSQSDLISLCNRAIVRAVRNDNVIRLKEEDQRQRKLR